MILFRLDDPKILFLTQQINIIKARQRAKKFPTIKNIAFYRWPL
jgi:hypothetical protein